MTRKAGSNASRDLAAMIEAANLKLDLRDFADLFLGIENTPRKTKFIKSLGPQMRAYLGAESDAEQFRQRYDALQAAQQLLPKLAEIRSDGEPAGFMSLPPTTASNLYVYKGVIGSSGCLTNALDGVSLDKFRKCAICRRLFWPLQRNSECCSLKCRKTFNQRNRRAAEKKQLAKKGGTKRGRKDE